MRFEGNKAFVAKNIPFFKHNTAKLHVFTKEEAFVEIGKKRQTKELKEYIYRHRNSANLYEVGPFRRGFKRFRFFLPLPVLTLTDRCIAGHECYHLRETGGPTMDQVPVHNRGS